jgi:hypothetical protein
MILRSEVGTAEDGQETYFLSTGIPSSCPIIENRRTGKQWHIGWEELIGLAREAGIDNESPDSDEDPTR